jgi:hypothetical protein
MGIQERLERKFFVSYISAKPFHCSCKKILSFLLCKQMLALLLRYRVHSVFCELIVNSNTIVSFHHTMAMKHSFADDEIERKLKCK